MIAPAVIEFSIPACPRSRNRLDQHWALRAKEDERWRDLVAVHRTTGRRIAGPVSVALTFRSPRPCDPDNLCRQVLNAMKRRQVRIGKKMVTSSHGLIDDDSWQVVRRLTLVSEKGPARTTIRIESAE